MRISCRPTCAFALAGMLCASLAFAQDPQAQQDPDNPQASYTGEISVIEKEEPALTSPSVAKAEKELKAVPGGTSLVDAETYERGRVATLKDALEFAPGVLVQPRFGSEEARLSIRGSGLQRTFHGRGLKLLQDGVPLNLADGAFDFQAVEPLAARYVEVFRGGERPGAGLVDARRGHQLRLAQRV